MFDSIWPAGAAHPRPEAAHELVVEIAVDATDAHVVEEHPRAGQRPEHLHDLVALDEAPQDRRQAADVEREPAHEQRVAGDPVELRGEDPDVLRAPRDLHVEQLLEGHDRRPLAEERRDVLQRIHVRDRVVVVGILGELLDATVQVAQDRVEVHDLLAAQLQDDPQHAVGRRVLGTHVHVQLALGRRVELGLALGSRRVRRDRLEDPGLLVEEDARIVGGCDSRGGHRQAPLATRIAVPGAAFRGAWDCSTWRTPPPAERAASSGR